MLSWSSDQGHRLSYELCRICPSSSSFLTNSFNIFAGWLIKEMSFNNIFSTYIYGINQSGFPVLPLFIWARSLKMVETWRNWVLKTFDLQVDMKRSDLLKILETGPRLASLTSAQRRSTFRPSTPPQLYFAALLYQVTARSEASLVDLSWLPPSSRHNSSPPLPKPLPQHTPL